MVKEDSVEVVLEEELKNPRTNIYLTILKKVLRVKIGRDFLLKKLQDKVYKELVLNEKVHPKNVQLKKYQYVVAMIEGAKRNYEKGFISKEVADRYIDTLVGLNFLDAEKIKGIKNGFEKKYGMQPPGFLVFSPTQKCNLTCVDCYASSTSNAPTLPYEVVDKIFSEVYNEWGNRFMTISGGEPFMYNSSGKTFFDIWKKYDEMFFLVYTNGSLITPEVAEKLAKLGNVTPAISVEGYEKETDERRGKGMFKKIIEATNNLKKAGVPFGVSVTATSKNIDILLDDKFYDFAFKELGATYMWMFQLMPVGRAKDVMKCMITPEQRVKLFRKWEELLKEKKYCIGDFWNSGVIADGCIAYGRPGGYLYIDWNGNITPCGFVPFYEDNIVDLYKKGKKLSDALFSQLFVNGRKWQKDYGLDHRNKPSNWLMPCSIRDHWGNFKNNILTKNSKPEDMFAAAIMDSPEYDKVLEDFDKELMKRTLPIWKKEYLEEN
jgi:MoaA/NifB/PqqE/SkfB family radical SAM enzyme